MEVATTNNHNQAHHHQHQAQQNHTHLLAKHSRSSNSGGKRSPFQREVREWQHIDPETGALLSGRLEADRWINGPLNSYEKISDSQNVSKPNGTQHTQRKQLEVLQSHTANGAMQVIRSQTVQTTSSRWSNPPTPSPTLSVGTTINTENKSNPKLLSNNTTHFANISTNSSYQDNHSHQQLHQHTNNMRHTTPSLNEFNTPALFSLTVSTPPSPISATTEATSNYNCPLSGVQISEALDEDYVANDIGGYIIDDSEEHDYFLNCGSSNSTIHSINSSTYNSQDETTNTINSFFQRLNSNSSLVDTAPSLKLSNLMKSSSSISSNNSSNNSLIKATASSLSGATMNNTHRLPSKISLHAIVGNKGNTSTSADNMSTGSRSSNDNNDQAPTTACSLTNTRTQSPAAATITTKTTVSAPTSFTAMSNNTTTQWQQQLRRRSSLVEQPDLFGNNMNSSNNSTKPNLRSLTKSHVGVTDAVGKSMQSSNALNDGNAVNDVPYFKRQPSIELTPTQSHVNRQMREQDYESFQHFSDNTGNSELAHSSTLGKSNAALYSNQYHAFHQQTQRKLCKLKNYDDDVDAMRISTRQQRRQQQPHESASSFGSLHRSRSISTDDLSSDWNVTDPTKGEDTPSEWRRVSKLRRSFQLSHKNETNPAPQLSKRPVDIPINMGNVAKIRAELEKKRRELLSSTTTTNIHDQTDSDYVSEIKPKATKRSTFLTAETLRQIRGNLKQLSDESLYKDDLWALRKATADELKVQEGTQEMHKSQNPEWLARQITPEESTEMVASKSAFQVVAQRAVSATTQSKTHTLESRQKLKDTNPAEWHFRRKSYGFEKMSPPEDRAMFRMDASTDSGLGRSGELTNWSPIETMSNKRSTIVQFGDAGRPQDRYQSPTDSEADDYTKRYSIAVDEGHYMRKSTQVNINGNTTAVEQTNSATTNTLFQRKRVEFCKTEVHFAAESGRVNIVETDGKPPPTNNFRRRRRTTTGPLQSLAKTPANAAQSPTTIRQFGADELLLSKHRTIAQTTLAYTAPLVDGDETSKVQTPNFHLTPLENARFSTTSTSGIDTTDNENEDIAAIRGILKNKPVKPKPYHLGENIEKPTDLWSTQQVKSNSSTAKINESMSKTSDVGKSISERIRLAEQQHDVALSSKTNGFSTTINVSLTDSIHHPIDHDSAQPSNKMSIALHSPQANLTEPCNSIANVPVAKPRATMNARTEQQEVQIAQTVCQPTKSALVTSPIKLPKDSLKIIKESRGARKLREHELSYFGVTLSKDESYESSSTQSTTEHRQQLRITTETTNKTSTKLKNDTYNENNAKHWPTDHANQPSELLHAPKLDGHVTNSHQIRPAVRKSLHQPQPDPSDENQAVDDHVYENITNELKPVFKVRSSTPVEESYDRKTDVTRDAMILSEMTRNADQTLKSISDEAALKDQRRQRRHSLHRNSTRPLETIDEKIFAEKINDKCIVVNVTRGTFASEARRSSRHSTPSPKNFGRSSSQSSSECPRARSRSRSLSSEHEYENAPVKPIRSAATVSSQRVLTAKQQKNRSSSLDSQQSQRSQRYSSDDEKPRRTRSKRTSAEQATGKHKADNEAVKHASISTLRSSRSERNKCSKGTDTAAKLAEHQQHTHLTSTAAIATQHSQRRRQQRVDDVTRNTGGQSTVDQAQDRSLKVHRSKDGSLTRSGRLERSSRSVHESHNSNAQRLSSRSERDEREKITHTCSSAHSSRSSNKHSSHSDRLCAPATTSTRQRDKTHSNAATKHSADKIILSKNAVSGTQPNDHQVQHQMQFHQHPMHVHKMTTAAVTSKHRERRNGKDRK